MDKRQCEEAIIRLEKELDLHSTKFADNPVHMGCRSRFLKVIDSLRTELAKELVKAPYEEYDQLNFDPEDFGQVDFQPGETRINSTAAKNNF